MQKRNNITGLLFASPWIVGFLVLQLFPIFATIYYSFTKFNLMQSPVFIGLNNYIELFGDDLFRKSILNTLYMLVLTLPLSLITSLLLALLLNLKVRGLSIYRTIFYIPTIVPPVAQAVLWFFILNPEVGYLNSFLKMIGLPQPNWLSDPVFTKPSLTLISIWTAGNMVIIFLAALQDIPFSLIEAADIDGANAFKKFVNITIPWISPAILYQVIVNIIYYMQYFTQAYVIIAGSSASALNDPSNFGGPENSLNFYTLYLFQVAFNFFKMGKASAMAWILFVVSAIVTVLIFKTSYKWVNYGGE